MTGPRILLVDFAPSNAAGKTLGRILKDYLPVGPVIEAVLAEASLSEAYLSSRGLSRGFDPHVVFISLSEKAEEIVSRFHLDFPDLPIIVVGDVKHPDEILSLLRKGAVDFIVPPPKAVDVIPRVRRLLETESGVPTRQLKRKLGMTHLLGRSPAFASEIDKIPMVAQCEATVLISGETGTGKELCARAIHYLSPRAKHPFVPINCGAIPADLAENELFGHERGAYTSATNSQQGMIEQADSGTVFLDEVDCLSQHIQVKLLRFLQDKEYRPLGSSRVRRADVRIIAATNADIEQLVGQGSVRQDLYYRINVIPLTLVPLRERPDDIPLLANHFLGLRCDVLKRGATDISPAAMQKLMLYDWPGNVRELEHVIERAVVMCQGPVLTEHDITLSRFQQTASPSSFQENKAKVVSQFERNYIKGLLAAYRGNISKAAKAANKNRRAFWELIRKHGIDASSFRQSRRDVV